MDVVTPIVLILGGLLAASGLIISKQPNAKKLIDKLTPYQAFIGIAMLACGLYWTFRFGGWLIDIVRFKALLGLSMWGVIVSSILLGFLFGMPQIAKAIPGDSPVEQRLLELSKKVAPFQATLGLIGLASSVVWLYYRYLA